MSFPSVASSYASEEGFEVLLLFLETNKIPEAMNASQAPASTCVNTLLV